jgi:murein L,D-transpeptidase YcbB/YkuD
MHRRPFRFSPWLAFCFFVLSNTPALADPPPAAENVPIALAAENIQKALATEDMSIGDYALDKDDLNTFYAAREYRPAWNFAGPENAAAFSAFLDSVDKLITWHGLMREDYALDAMRGLGAQPDNDSRLKLELLVTDTLLRLAHDLHGDDADLGELYPGWNFHRADLDIAGNLAKAVASNGINDFIDGLAPKNPAYGKLAHVLHQYSAMAAKGEWPSIDPGPILRPKDNGPRVAQLRARLRAENYVPDTPLPEDKATFFDIRLHKALQDYQRHNGLDANGHLSGETLGALNVPLGVRIDQIRANMERWRHMPDDFPPPRAAIVNIPDFSIEISDGGEVIYRGPVIVGQVERKTPYIQSEIRSMIINPAWHVPAKIAKADILPKLRQDPHYLEKLGFTIRGSDSDPHGERIDWKNMSDEEFNFRLRQQPGAMNSLGRLKFDFDNDFAVYLHGTPHQELFRKDARALSSGCVRLRDPEKVAAIVLKDTPGAWDAAHIEDAIATRKTRWIEIENPLPIDIVYWTVFTGEDGRLEFRRDIYDEDSFLMENLKSGLEAPDETKKSDSNPQAP